MITTAVTCPGGYQRSRSCIQIGSVGDGGLAARHDHDRLDDVNRRTLDTAVPMVYAIIVVIMWLTVKGTAATVVTVVGAMLVGLYYAALRQNFPPGPSSS
jgi:hypothetical protein